MAVIQSLDETDFQGRRLSRPGRVAVLFRMATCPYSRAFRSEYGQWPAPEGVLLADYVFGSFYERLPLTFDVSVVPTVLGFEDGALRWRHDGAPGKGLGEDTLREILTWAASAKSQPSSRGDDPRERGSGGMARR